MLKKYCTWEVKEGVNNLVSFLEEWRSCSTLDARTALLLVMCYHYLCIPQSKVSTWFCQPSTGTIGRRLPLTWRSVLLWDFESKTVGYRKMGLCKPTVIGEQNKQFSSWLQPPW